jgi:hypothetical protein
MIRSLSHERSVVSFSSKRVLLSVMLLPALADFAGQYHPTHGTHSVPYSDLRFHSSQRLFVNVHHTVRRSDSSKLTLYSKPREPSFVSFRA